MMILEREDRAGEYRIPERDKFSSGKLVLPDETIVKYSRYVYRVGYALDPRSYTEEEWAAAGFELVCKQTELPGDEVKKVIDALKLFSPYRGIRGQIYTKLVGDKATDFVRSMWFKDCQVKRGVIMGRRRKWTGTYSPGRNYGDWYSGDFGYDPATLDQAVNQNLYWVLNTNNGGAYMVHPLDIQVVGNGR